jgi:hypothetical protein
MYATQLLTHSFGTIKLNATELESSNILTWTTCAEHLMHHCNSTRDLHFPEHKVVRNNWHLLSCIWDKLLTRYNTFYLRENNSPLHSANKYGDKKNIHLFITISRITPTNNNKWRKHMKTGFQISYMVGTVTNFDSLTVAGTIHPCGWR